MRDEDPLEEAHRKRSNFIRGVIQGFPPCEEASRPTQSSLPRRIVHFWDDLDQLPEDVQECIASWGPVQNRGVELQLYDYARASDDILSRMGRRFEGAFARCYHPAMQSDYFRLCTIFAEGGCYIDADEVYRGGEIDHLFGDERLALHPLCYDMKSDAMVPSTIFREPGADSSDWIFYFNNNPLIAPPHHPVIKKALMSATAALEDYPQDQYPEIQSATGPGNLSKAVYEHAMTNPEVYRELRVLRDWEALAIQKWDLSYRNDRRNWRLSNRQPLRSPIQVSENEDAS